MEDSARLAQEEVGKRNSDVRKLPESLWTRHIDSFHFSVAFKVYDMDRDGFISNGELFVVLKMMVGNNLKVLATRLVA